MADALNKARLFILGCTDLIMAVDHKPLHKVLGNRSVENVQNSCLRNLNEKTLGFRFRMVHAPGIQNKVADSILRYPSGNPYPDKMDLLDDAACITTQVNLPHPQQYREHSLPAIAPTNLKPQTLMTAPGTLQSTH